MPSALAVALVAQVVGRVGAEGVVSTGIWRAGCQHVCAGGSAVGQLAHTGVAGHTIHTGALVQTRHRRTLIDVGLAQVPFEALATFAGESVELVQAGSCVLTRAG